MTPEERAQAACDRAWASTDLRGEIAAELRAYAAERLREAAEQLHVEADQRYPAGKHDEAMGFRKAANAVGALAEREARGEET